MRPIVPALILIVLGIFFLLNNLGLWDVSLARIIHTWWPLILILVGISMLFKRTSK